MRYDSGHARHLCPAQKRMPVRVCELQKLETRCSPIDLWMWVPDLRTPPRSASGPDRRPFRVQRIAHEIGRCAVPTRSALVPQEIPPLKPTRNLRYLAWIRTLPCLVRGRTRGVKAAHTGPHGVGQKPPDTSAVPLCARHHRTGRDSYHKLGPRAFERHHGLDLRAIVAGLTERPFIRIEAGSFVGRYRDEDYVLGPIQTGCVSQFRGCWRSNEKTAFLRFGRSIPDFRFKTAFGFEKGCRQGSEPGRRTAPRLLQIDLSLIHLRHAMG